MFSFSGDWSLERHLVNSILVPEVGRKRGWRDDAEDEDEPDETGGEEAQEGDHAEGDEDGEEENDNHFHPSVVQVLCDVIV